MPLGAPKKVAKKPRKPRKRTIWVSLLNVVAHPHDPRGAVYVQLLEEAVSKRITERYYGDRWARIGSANKQSDGVVTGEIWTYFVVDPKQAILRLGENRELRPEEVAKIDFDWDGHGFNTKKLAYVFDPKSHRLGFEANSMSAKTLAPVLRSILSVVKKVGNVQTITVTVEQSEAKLAKILGMKLEELEIRIERPNADIAEYLAEFEANLESMNASAETRTIEAEAGKELKPDEETKLQAKAALSNGHVVGKGLDSETGRIVTQSTEESPIRQPAIQDPAKESVLDVVARKAFDLIDHIIERGRRR